LKTAASLLAIDDKIVLFICNNLVINGERPEGSNSALPQVSARRAAQPGDKQSNPKPAPGGCYKVIIIRKLNDEIFFLYTEFISGVLSAN
jgi:hypothetical protein